MGLYYTESLGWDFFEGFYWIWAWSPQDGYRRVMPKADVGAANEGDRFNWATAVAQLSDILRPGRNAIGAEVVVNGATSTGSGSVIMRSIYSEYLTIGFPKIITVILLELRFPQKFGIYVVTRVLELRVWFSFRDGSYSSYSSSVFIRYLY